MFRTAKTLKVLLTMTSFPFDFSRTNSSRWRMTEDWYPPACQLMIEWFFLHSSMIPYLYNLKASIKRLNKQHSCLKPVTNRLLKSIDKYVHSSKYADVKGYLDRQRWPKRFSLYFQTNEKKHAHTKLYLWWIEWILIRKFE